MIFRRRGQGRRANQVGRVREKLAALICAQGFFIDAADLRWVDGQYSHVTDDCERWTGHGKIGTGAALPWDMDAQFYSWDTMTDCARHGIIIEHCHDDPATIFQVHAKEPA